MSRPSHCTGPEEDIKAILEVVEIWDRATRARQPETLLGLVTEDCVFLAPGFPPIRGKATLAPYLNALGGFELDPLFELQELVVSGDWAFFWAKDELTATTTGGVSRSAKGWAVSILHRESDGRWRFSRGINTKTEAASPPPQPLNAQH